MSRPVSVRRTLELDDALTVLASYGINTTDAVRQGVVILAEALSGAYGTGLAPKGTPLEVVACTVQPRQGPASDVA